jgi:hypothetical protein
MSKAVITVFLLLTFAQNVAKKANIFCPFLVVGVLKKYKKETSR